MVVIMKYNILFFDVSRSCLKYKIKKEIQNKKRNTYLLTFNFHFSK